MNKKVSLRKFSLIITTRCNLRCKLCCEYVPQHTPFPDMTLEECKSILNAFFSVIDHVEILHLTGGGEPFLNKNLPQLVDECMVFSDRFDRLMLFTNCTISPSSELLEALKKYQDKIILQVSSYNIMPERENAVFSLLEKTGANLKVVKYHGDAQSFDGWVDFGSWEDRHRTLDELNVIFNDCAITNNMKGNWRTRNGKTHWCPRSQRGTELGLLPDFKDDYVDLFDNSTREEKRLKFKRISESPFLQACGYCSGNYGTIDKGKRYRAAEQMETI
ncbi:hypothetical protein SDC9_44026 [bioreactor metagenome]|uniref:Radical SAM core domain-containing protein n=1 Tax=bioreactor metagenome TaxID=1076179 RepID=A0A644W2B0_9ZZZZ